MKNINITDLYGYESDYKYLNKLINHALKKLKIKNAIFSIIFIDDEKMHEMNKKYRGIDRTTDVLSFALEDNDDFVNSDVRILGDIYISIPKMKSQAREYGHSEKRELSFLTIHGLLHLLGYDHQIKEDEEIMFGLQEAILNEEKIC